MVQSGYTYMNMNISTNGVKKFGGFNLVPAELVPLYRKRNFAHLTEEDEAAEMLLQLNKKPNYSPPRKPIRVLVVLDPKTWNYHKPTREEMY